MAGKKKAKKRTAKRRRTVVVYPTAQGTLEPFQIHGSWKVKRIKVQPPTKTIGLKSRKSKFDVDFDGTTHFLRKTAEVRWNAGGSDRIDLKELRANDIDRSQNIVLKATIDLDGQKFVLGLGSDDTGTTLKIQLVPVDTMQVNPGGTGTAGRSS